MIEMQTQYGPIYVTAQGDRRLYVQAGRGTSRKYGEPDPPNLIVRGIPIYVNAHLERDTATSLWRVQQGFASIKRAPAEGSITGGGDAPPGATKLVIEAILAAVEEFPEEELTQAQVRERESQASDREDNAAKLTDLAARLLIEATALRAGGRVEYHEHRLQSGLRYTGRHVRTVDGELLPTLPAVTVYGCDDYGPRLPND